MFLIHIGWGVCNLLYTSLLLCKKAVVPSILAEREMLLMHWDIAKLLTLGVEENFLKNADLKPEQARDLVKGLLYLKERFKDEAK
jgi:hypothetical protein